jgi:hypothetical protein
MELKGESLRKKRQAVEENQDDYKRVNLLFLITAFTANYTTLRAKQVVTLPRNQLVNFNKISSLKG